MEARIEVSCTHRRSQLTQGPVSTLNERSGNNRFRKHAYPFEDAGAANGELEPASAILQKNMLHAIGRM